MSHSVNRLTKCSFCNLDKYARKRLIDDNPFEVEKIRRGKSNPIWLTEKELGKLISLYQTEMLPANMHRVLQYFLFSAFTGLRLSDVKAFDMEQVKGDFIMINPVKTKRTTNQMVVIPITKPIQRIIDDVAKYRVKGKIFECYADAVTNRMLKKIADYANINKEISFHSARHTFATFFLERTDDLATLQRLLGHSSISQTMVYVHLTEKKKVDQMQKCWDNLVF